MIKRILPFIVLILSFLIRIPYLNKPPITFHSWKQSDTYAVAEKYYENKSGFLDEKSNLNCDFKKRCLYLNGFPYTNTHWGIYFERLEKVLL